MFGLLVKQQASETSCIGCGKSGRFLEHFRIEGISIYIEGCESELLPNDRPERAERFSAIGSNRVVPVTRRPSRSQRHPHQSARRSSRSVVPPLPAAPTSPAFAAASAAAPTCHFPLARSRSLSTSWKINTAFTARATIPTPNRGPGFLRYERVRDAFSTTTPAPPLAPIITAFTTFLSATK